VAGRAAEEHEESSDPGNEEPAGNFLQAFSRAAAESGWSLSKTESGRESVAKRAYRPHRRVKWVDTETEMPENPGIDTSNADWELMEQVAEHQHHSPLMPGFGFDEGPNPAVVDYDGMGATVVTFTQDSTPGRSRQAGRGPDYEELARLNEGRHSATGDLSTRNAERDKIRITHAFCSTLDVPRHQATEAARVMLLLDLDRFGNQKRLERGALGVINVVVNWHRFQVQQNPDADRINETRQFKELMTAHDVSDSDLWSLSRIVKRELRDMDYFDSARNG